MPVRQQARSSSAASSASDREWIAAALPPQIICDMMGIPRRHQAHLELTNTILGVGDPEYVQTMEELMGAGMALFQYGLALAEDRAANPRDDITSSLMAAEIEDENGRHRLTSSELGSFFLLLVAAGNETTRNAINGVRADQQSDQRALAERHRQARPPSGGRALGDSGDQLPAHRRATPSWAGRIKAGDKVDVLQPRRTATRQFPDSYRFDDRTPNEHRFLMRRPALLPGRTSLCDQRDVRGDVPPTDIHTTASPTCCRAASSGIKRMRCADAELGVVAAARLAGGERA
jgi:hypothetical protein